MAIDMDLTLAGVFCWRRVVELGYCPLESFLSVEPLIDSALICVDPDGADTMRLVNALANKFPSKVRVVEFPWPIGSTGDGSVIGIASNFALQQVRTSHAINIQADEAWSPQLMNLFKDKWREAVSAGYDCLSFKTLHTEFNAQQFQGGDLWDGRKDTPEWNWQKGAGYNRSVKFFKVCPAIRFESDGWSMSGCGLMRHVTPSEEFPIIHLHDFHRDSYIAMRRNAADALWTDQEKFGHYKASADTIQEQRETWWDDPKWTATTSPFDALLPDFVKPLIGRTKYAVNWQLLMDWPNYG